MKKILNICCIAALCGTLFTQQAYALDINNMGNNQSIYASNAEQVEQSISEDNSNLSKTLTNLNISIESDCIMPVYKASFYDFARTGEFNITPMNFEAGQLYVSEVDDTKGEFAGVAMFTVDGNTPDVHMYAPLTSEASSVDFRANSARVNSLLAKNNFNTNSFDAKLVFVDGLGYVYYLNNGTEEVLIAAGLKGANGNIFTEGNGGIVKIDDNLRNLASNELDAYQKQLDYLTSLPEGENPVTGSSIPAFVVDNTAYVAKDMQTPSIVAISLTAFITLCIGCFFHKKSATIK